MSVLAMSEAIRTIRFLNILLALLIIVSPWIFAGSTTHGTINNLIVGVVIIVLSISRGKISESYGAWNKLIY
jgi:membrane protein required for beta-lactamase induction